MLFLDNTVTPGHGIRYIHNPFVLQSSLKNMLLEETVPPKPIQDDNLVTALGIAFKLLLSTVEIGGKSSLW